MQHWLKCGDYAQFEGIAQLPATRRTLDPQALPRRVVAHA
jgi:hypothetical protein